GFGKGCTRLHPRPGAPKPDQSSVGGPLLWPADETLPVCREPHRRDRGRRVEDVHEERRVFAEAWRRGGAGPTDEERRILTELGREHQVPELGDNAPMIGRHGVNTPTKVRIGRGGHLDIFVCSADPTHDHKLSFQG
ncbi:hypothetical protein ABZV46_47930, partial [Streptomyces sp. NPDC005209]